MFRERFYREGMGEGRFTPLSFALESSDLWVGLSPEADAELARSLLPGLVAEARGQVERYASSHPAFLESLEPLPDDDAAPPLARRMLLAGRAAGVGPLAAVAGAVAEAVGRGLEEALHPREIVVENGGDLWVSIEEPLVAGLYAGLSSLSGRIGVELTPEVSPLGLCTSSAKVGPSLSLGNADAALVAARSASLADAWATALGNLVKTREDLEGAVERVAGAEGVLSCLAVRAESAAAAGSLRVLPIARKA